MRLRNATIDCERPLTRLLDIATEASLLCLIAFAPLAYGAVEAWSEEIVLALAAITSISAAVRFCITAERPTALPRSWMFPGLLLALAAFQLVQLPGGLARVVSPGTAAMKTHLMSDLPDSHAPETMAISFYPNATRHDLRLLFAVATVFATTSIFYRDDKRIRRLLITIVTTGTVVALSALAQSCFGIGVVHRATHLPRTAHASGPFVNHNHFAQFVNLSTGAALGLLLLGLHQADDAFGPVQMAMRRRSIGHVSRLAWLSGLAIVFLVTAVFLSLSRGGMIAILAGSTVVTVLLIRRRLRHVGASLLLMLGTAAFACVLYIGFDGVWQRAASLAELRQADTGRWALIVDSLGIWRCFPLFGIGLGTHAMVFGAFDSSTVGSLAGFVENEYVQMLEETGIVGFALATCLVMCIMRSVRRSLTSPHATHCCCGIGIAFGLTAVAVHSMTDFGLRIPAVGLPAAVLAGLAVAMGSPRKASCKQRSLRPVTHRNWMHRRFARVALATVLTGMWVWILCGADAARCAEGHWHRARQIERKLAGRNRQGSDTEYTELIRTAAAAVDSEPGNVEYRYALSAARWRAMRGDNSNRIAAELSDVEREMVERIVGELHKCRRLAPTFAPPLSLAGQLERFVLGRAVGAKHIRRACELAPCNAEVVFAAGILDVEEGRTADAERRFVRAMRLNAHLFGDAAQVCITRLNRTDLAIDLAGGDIERLELLLEYIDTTEQQETARLVQDRLFDALQAACARYDCPGRMHAQLGQMHLDRAQFARAIACLRRALAQAPACASWRFALARALAGTAKRDAAIEQARVALTLDPERADIRAFIAQQAVAMGTHASARTTQ